MDSSHVIFLAVLATVTGVVLLIRLGKKHNKTDWGHAALNVLDGINAWFCRSYHRLPDRLLELPEHGPALLVSNHVSGLDPIIMIAATNRPLRFMIAQEEFDRWWLKWLLARMGCIPVKRDKNPRKAFRESLAALDSDEILAVFPQGAIVTDAESRPLKKGAFVLARLARVPLICIRINGVRGRGLTLLAPFIRSNVTLSRHPETYLVTDENMAASMNDMHGFFSNRIN